MSRVTWSEGARIDIETLRKTELQIGFAFPQDFAAIVRENDGAVPQPEVYSGKRFGVLISVNCENKRNVVRLLRTRVDLFPAGVVPFASGPGGDYLSFDFRIDRRSPTVVLVEHEQWEDADREDFIKPIAISFTALIEMLGNAGGPQLR